MITDRQYARDVTAQDIRDLIVQRQRESNELEYKVSADADLLKAACGIANAGGGYILLGVDEDDQHCASAVVNILNSARVEESIRQRLRDGLAPRPVIEVVPLLVDSADIIVIRVSPQNPPHMVSLEKKTDFFGRYDATTERMRYEEIEQRFREKHESARTTLPETVHVVIETIGGRASVSRGAKEAFDGYVARVRESQEPTVAIIAVSDGNEGSVTESDATSILAMPLYGRQGGWVVAHPDFDVTHTNGVWAQPYGSVSTTTVNPSGDLIFLKAVDEVLSWRQSEADFKESPRLYPNALIEYCLSFAYVLADIAAVTCPKQLFVTPVLSHATGCHLPLGEGGSVWFDAPSHPPKRLESAFATGLAIPVDTAGGKRIAARNLAFLIAAQIYSFFGYREDQVAFASDREITIESDPDIATLTSMRAYLQNVLHMRLSAPREDFERGVYWLNTKYLGKSYRIGASEEFVEDHHWTEERLFAELNQYKIAELISTYGPDEFLMITNEGMKRVPRQS